ncbi:undecaprenyl-diphosphate phosphatase [Planctomycetota bacterium]|nr:undecaprenyl-diphosphate phosphatase [Planctomycetota bacterium]
MEIIKAIILGAVQGLTEFLPVSSSGHLVILGAIMGDQFGGGTSTAQSVLLHLGSLVAIAIVFRKDIIGLFAPKIQWHKLRLLFIASIPAAIAGLVIKKGLPDAQQHWVEVNLLQSVWVASVALLFTAMILWLAERPRKLDRDFNNTPTWPVFLIGIAQMFAIMPGVSRSGSTICIALMLRWVKDDAIRLSFLMGLIAIGGAGLIEAREISSFDVAPAVAGFASSLIFSLLGLWGIKFVVEKNKLRYFAAYCAVAGVAAICWFTFQ